MKKLYAICLAMLAIAALHAQTSFVDSFESYNVGDFLAQSSSEWTTWSNNPGSAEDVKITDTDAYSGTQSVYFQSSNPDGGPQDVVLPFGDKYETGQFTLSMMVKVDSNKGGYFNLQGEETIGEEWALSIHLINGNTLYVFDGNNDFALQADISHSTWFKLTVDINLNFNQWSLLIDGNKIGTFANPINAVASLDLFPVNASNLGGNGECGFYVDDVRYEIQPYVLPAHNGAMISVESNLLLVGQKSEPTLLIRNLGQNTITSFDLDVTYDGNQYKESITGVSIPSLDFYEVTMSEEISAVADSNEMVATISNVNGLGSDGDALDNTAFQVIDPVVPADGKMVIAEEGTGTWCGWCPRGHVAMADLGENFSDFVAPIAVHNSDPMEVPAYDNAIGALISGYPAALVNRGLEIDPSAIKVNMLQDIANPPVALLSHKAYINENTRELEVDLTVEFMDDTSGTWKVAMVVTEDSVTGTSTAYDQVNYYSYETQDIPLVGAGIDWQAAPDPVPASQMVYDFVARDIVPSFAGSGSSIPQSVNAGDTFHHTFKTILDTAWNLEHMNIICMIIQPSGEIDNGSKSHMDDAERVITGIEIPESQLDFQLSPNPASETAYLKFGKPVEQEIVGTITDISGKTVRSIGPSTFSGKSLVPLNLQGLSRGIYLIQVSAGQTTISRKLIIQ